MLIEDDGYGRSIDLPVCGWALSLSFLPPPLLPKEIVDGTP